MRWTFAIAFWSRFSGPVTRLFIPRQKRIRFRWWIVVPLLFQNPLWLGLRIENLSTLIWSIYVGSILSTFTVRYGYGWDLSNNNMILRWCERPATTTITILVVAGKTTRTILIIVLELPHIDINYWRVKRKWSWMSWAADMAANLFIHLPYVLRWSVMTWLIPNKCLGILSALAQNNPPAQEGLLELGAIKTLSDLFLQQNEKEKWRCCPEPAS